MAEGAVYINRRDDTREEEIEIEEEEALYKHSEEVSLDKTVRERAKCESCVRKVCPWREGDLSYEDAWYNSYERARQLYGRVAVFLCFLCKMFVCAECLPKHRLHEIMKVERKVSEEKGMFSKIKKRLQKAEREESESDGMRRNFVLGLVNESERLRKEKFFSSHRIVCDRFEVKHELDQKEHCWITGLCGLEYKSLAVCDNGNSCIKIFKLGSHVLQRYIRFVGPDSRPWDVTEIDSVQNSTKSNLVSGSSSDISAADRADPIQQCFIAVTLPGKHQIMFINLSKIPAEPNSIIETEGKCYSIQFYNDRIFTVCIEGHVSRCYCHTLSTDGRTLNKFYTGIHGYIPRPYLAVVSMQVYLTDMDNHKVQCRNVEGRLISEITIEGSEPVGTSVDPDNNVYVCARDHNKVYKLDADLTRYRSVLDQTADFIEYPWAICYYRDKLFISHDWPSSLQNFVTVVRLL